MKRIALTLCLFALPLLAANTESITFSTEVSGLLSSPDYARALKDAESKLPQGYALRVAGAAFDRIGNETYARVILEKEYVAMFPSGVSPFGALVGQVNYGVEEHRGYVSKVFFEPAAEPARR